MKHFSLLLLVLVICFIVNDTKAQWQIIGSQVPSTTSGFNDRKVFFLNDTLGYGLFNKTTNGGNNWLLMNGVQGGANIFFSDELIGHRTHNTNTGPPAYERTVDGGNSWIELSSALPTNPYGYYDVFFPSTDTGYIINNGRFFKTTDTGTTWATKYQNANFITTSLYFPVADIGYIIGYNTPSPYDCKILITKDGGNNWDSIPLPFTSGGQVVFAPDTNNVYVISGYYSNGKIIHSGDGGYNWTQQFSDSNKVLWDIFFTSKDTGYVVGAAYQTGLDTGLVLKTTDGGNNWLVQPTGYNKSLIDCHFISSEVGWIAGGNGEVLHTANGGEIVGISESNVLQNKINIYPNPVQYAINIQLPFNLINAELTIFDSFGRAVKIISNINDRQITIDCKKFSNGLYLVLLKNANKQTTGKFIIDK